MWDEEHSLQYEWSQVNKVKFVGIGFALGAAESLALYPMDVIKTHMQAETSRAQPLTSLITSARDLMAKSGRGLPALYRGFTVSLMGNTPSAIVYLGSYNKLRDVGTDLFHPHNFFARSILVPMVAGAIADATSVVVCTPFDVVTTHMQRVNGRYNGRVPTVVKQIWHQEGFRGFYRGLSAAVLSYTPNSALWWPSYEASKVVLGKIFLPKEAAASGPAVAAIVAVAGGTAGAIAAGLTNPMDLVRTRMVLGHGCYEETNPWKLLKTVVVREGWKALLKGVVPRTLQAIPASAVGSFTYELTIRLSLEKPD